MAVYTIELGRLIKTGYDIGLNDYPLPSYLSNDNERNQFRNALNQKIINHYTFDEICCTAPDRFKQLLNNTMREIMPVKNLLYDALAENWKFYAGSSLTEVISDTRSDTHSNSQTGIDRTDRTGGGKSTKAGTDAIAKTGTDATAKTGNDKLARSGVDTTGNITNSNSSNNGYVLSVASDTPAQMLNIETDIATNTYASSANKNKSTGSSTGNATSTDTTTYNSTNTTTYNSTDTTTYNNTDTTTYNTINTTTTTGTDTTTHEAETSGNDSSKYERSRTVSGLSGKSYAELLKEYQEAIRNVDMEIIEALSSCFMSIY